MNFRSWRTIVGAALAALALTAAVLFAALPAPDQFAAAQGGGDDGADAPDEDGIFTTDDRSPRLQSLTETWGTNWARRTISTAEILSGGPPRDGIPSIDDPQFITTAEAGEWLAGNEPVIALAINDDARAYPLQIMTWHEIVNDEVGGEPVVVTFCPLCNSAIVFDATVNGEVLAFGTSGLLRNSDLIMYDRTTETLWQQFTGEAIVGDLAGEQLTFRTASLISFDAFQEAYPEGVVLSRETGFSRSYGRNPYAGYDSTGSEPFLMMGPVDNRLAAMARVVTVHITGEDEAASIAYPYTLLRSRRVINDRVLGQEIAVFFVSGTSTALGAGVIADGEDVGATGVFSRELAGETLTFAYDDASDAIRDEQTGSAWNILGQAIEGELAGAQLEQVVAADHFWFSWAAFRPETVIYTGEAE